MLESLFQLAGPVQALCATLMTWALTSLGACVVFCDDPSSLDLEKLGPKFEHAAYFPERINTEFVRIVNDDTLRMRVYERGNGETVACGTGACAAVIAATENGYVEKGKDITVKLVGGDLVVNYSDHEVILTGDAVMVYEGVVEY